MDRQAVLLCSLLSRRGGSVSQCGGDWRANSETSSKQLEQARAELGSVRGELVMVKERARRMLVRGPSSLGSVRLESLLAGQNMEDNRENTESDPVTNMEIPGRSLARRSSQFLIAPMENIDKTEILSEFSHAMMTTSNDTMYVSP